MDLNVKIHCCRRSRDRNEGEKTETHFEFMCANSTKRLFLWDKYLIPQTLCIPNFRNFVMSINDFWTLKNCFVRFNGEIRIKYEFNINKAALKWVKWSFGLYTSTNLSMCKYFTFGLLLILILGGEIYEHCARDAWCSLVVASLPFHSNEI